MVAQPGLHTLAAALTAAVLRTRWCATRGVRDAHGADAAEAPWRRAAPPRDGGDPDRVAESPASFPDPVLRETDAHLDRYWNTLAPLYPPHRDGERRRG
ncbi:hypothetical protein ACFZCF_16805 [Streptomyces sp. NPDC007945]|uniref:hypothetical protein n=1 Tax=Streptomyces sp. NPDC007945 TaxID=3364797 RepID=UPI0036E24BE9